MRAAVRCAAASSRSPTTTLAPSAASRRAVTPPIEGPIQVPSPVPPAHTTMTLSLNPRTPRRYRRRRTRRADARRAGCEERPRALRTRDRGEHRRAGGLAGWEGPREHAERKGCDHDDGELDGRDGEVVDALIGESLDHGD